MSYDDNSIERRFLLGDPEAFGQVSRWVALILTLPRFHLVRRERTDLHQEVLRRVLENLSRGNFDAARDFRIYVQSIARYTARESVLRRIKTFQHHARATEVESSRPAEAEDLLHMRHAARKILAGVPDGCRRLFRLYFYEERSQAEIAERLEIAVGTVKSRLFRCLQAAKAQWAGNPSSVENKRKGERGA